MEAPESAARSTAGWEPEPWWRRVAFWRAAAGMGLALALAGIIIAAEFSAILIARTRHFSRRIGELNFRISELRHRLTADQNEVKSLRANETPDAILRRVLAAPDLRTIKLAASPVTSKSAKTGGSQSGRASIEISESESAAMLEASGFDRQSDSAMYRVWWVSEHDQVTLAGEFRPDQTGGATILLTLPPRGAASVTITSEIDPQATGPSGPVLLAAHLRKNAPGQ